MPASMPVPATLAIVCYLLAAALLVRSVARDAASRVWLLPALVGVVLHAVVHARAWQAAGGTATGEATRRRDVGVAGVE